MDAPGSGLRRLFGSSSLLLLFLFCLIFVVCVATPGTMLPAAGGDFFFFFVSLVTVFFLKKINRSPAHDGTTCDQAMQGRVHWNGGLAGVLAWHCRLHVRPRLSCWPVGGSVEGVFASLIAVSVRFCPPAPTGMSLSPASALYYHQTTKVRIYFPCCWFVGEFSFLPPLRSPKQSLWPSYALCACQNRQKHTQREG